MKGRSLASVSEVILTSTNWSAHGQPFALFKTVGRQRSGGAKAFILTMQSDIHTCPLVDDPLSVFPCPPEVYRRVEGRSYDG
jgi:hypothetical protein